MSDCNLSLQDKIGYRFENQELFRRALTHSSFANERKINKIEDYERLEFLGDAVLEMVSSEHLFRLYPEYSEGELTRLRASLVCEQALSFCAAQLGIGEAIFLGKGEEATGGRKRPSVTSDVVEAIIGAIFLDGGLDKAKEFILKFVLNDIENKHLFYDSKTILQEQVQKNKNSVLTYELIREEGPDHEKQFVVQALIDGVVRATGTGHSKKLAEQEAAYQILLEMKVKDKDKK